MTPVTSSTRRPALTAQDTDVSIDLLHGPLLLWDGLYWIQLLGTYLTTAAVSLAPSPPAACVSVGLALFWPMWATCNMHVPTPAGKVNLAVMALLQLGALGVAVSLAQNATNALPLLALALLGGTHTAVHTSDQVINCATLSNYRSFCALVGSLVLLGTALGLCLVHDK